MLRTFVRRYHHYGEERIATVRGKIMSQNQEPMESKCKFEPPSSLRGLSNQDLSTQISQIEKRMEYQSKLAEERFRVTGIMQSICVGHTIGALLCGIF